MPIWQFDPIDLTQYDWKGSIHKGRVILRARDERRARSHASRWFFIATGRKLGEKVVASPWRNPGMVTCKQLTDSGYDEEGPEEILDPPDYKEWERV